MNKLNNDKNLKNILRITNEPLVSPSETMNPGKGVLNDAAIYYMFARNCESILELGVSTGQSTHIFAWGLEDNGSINKRLLSVDIKPIAFKISPDWWEFKQISDYDLELDEAFDLVFIDTSHEYEHTKYELEKFGKLAKKWIICHDYCPTRVRIKSVVRAVNEYCEKHGYVKYMTRPLYVNKGVGITASVVIFKGGKDE